MNARTEPIVEVTPFMPKAQGISWRLSLFKSLIPTGKGIPINKPKGAKNSIDNKDFNINGPWIFKKGKEAIKRIAPIKIKVKMALEIFIFNLLVKRLPMPLNNSIENRMIMME